MTQVSYMTMAPLVQTSDALNLGSCFSVIELFLMF